jgi:hypothetical protein
VIYFNPDKVRDKNLEALTDTDIKKAFNAPAPWFSRIHQSLSHSFTTDVEEQESSHDELRKFWRDKPHRICGKDSRLTFSNTIFLFVINET